MGADHHKSCKPGTKQLVAGVILLIFGLGLGVSWYLVHTTVINDISLYEIKSNLVVSSTSSSGYEDWVEGTALRNPNYYLYYMWNITNIESVLVNGTTPIYAEVGPYVYRYYWYNRNASFSDGGNIVAYNLIEDYVFLPEQSVGDPSQDRVTNISPTYLGIIKTAGGESAVVLAATMPIIGGYLDFFMTDFVDIVSSQYVPVVLNPLTQQIAQNISAQLGKNISDAQQYFYTQWANASSVPSVMASWPNMILGNNITNISMSSAAQLFDPNVSYSLASNQTKSFFTWAAADKNNTGVEAELLCTTFGLTYDQLAIILTWRDASFITTYVQPAVLAVARQVDPSATWDDIGWLQYTNETFTDGESIGQVYPTYFPQYTALPIELASSQFSVAQTKSLLVGSNGITTSVQNFGTFGTLVEAWLLNSSSVGDTPFEQNWNISGTMANAFFEYLSGIAGIYTLPFILPLMNVTDGLITTQTVDYWLWSCQDPLLDYLMGPSPCGLQNNDTIQPVSQIWTGNDDINKINTYISWRNQTVVDYWAEPVTVKGATDSGQFAPGVSYNQTLYVWDENFIKTVAFNQNGNAPVQGINTYVYILDEGSFAASELYTNNITGFANETTSSQGVPIFLSNWDLYGAEPRYGNLSGMHPNVSDLTTLYVEPTTGTTIQANMKLQINIYFSPADAALLDESTTWSNVPSDMIYPLVKIWQQSSVGSQDADKLKKLLVLQGTPLNEGVLWGVVGLGALLALLGVLLIYFGNKNKKRHGYSAIQ